MLMAIGIFLIRNTQSEERKEEEKPMGEGRPLPSASLLPKSTSLGGGKNPPYPSSKGGQEWEALGSLN